MFMNVDVTPISAPNIANVFMAETADGTPFLRESLKRIARQPREDEQTPFLALGSAVSDATEPIVNGVAVQSDDPNVTDPQVTSLRDGRIALLVKKYEGAGSVEDDARFQILTERMRKLERPMADQAHAVLFEILSSIEAAATRADSVRAKFGLK
jgi:hypothetical protein